ncbi:MAG: Gfo/Idh/MocA family oxidoreductase, partial [Rhizobiaceae bacterium]|nr:Gfo/Idh/MocA family oxidoreductase [Rhizobiaceae bacterium]
MRIGILGSGFMGGTHARAFAKLPDVQVVAVSSRSQDKATKLAAEVGATATTDDLAIIDDPSIDAISNTLPTTLHRDLTVAALRAGKHVLLEKPFALNDEDCAAMMAAEVASGKHLMLAHVVRFWPEYEVLAKIVHSGKLGKPLAAIASRLSVLPGWADWFADPALSGGAVMDLMIHDFDALNWVMGKPKSIYARGQEAAPGLWNHVHCMIDYGDAHGFAEGSEMMPKDYPFSCGLSVLCEGGKVEFGFKAGGVSVEMGGGSQLVVYEPGKSYR